MLPWYSDQTSAIQSKATNHAERAKPKKSQSQTPSTLLHSREMDTH